MGQRPYVSFEEVKAKVPIPDVLQPLGIADRFQQRNGALVGVCPFPTHIHGPSPNSEQFRINQADGVWLWRCWGDCKACGNVVQFVMRFLGLSAEHVRFWFAEHFGERLTVSQGRGDRRSQPTTPAETKMAGEVLQEPRPADENLDNEKVPDGPVEYKPIRFRLNVDHQVPYLAERGIAVETAQRYGIGLVQKGMLAGYVAVPVWDFPKQKFPFGYLGRWPGEGFDASQGRPRYKLPANFPKQRCLFGINEALEETDGRPLVVVEGVFGTLHCVQNGFPATVSALGSSLSDEQIDLLVGTGRRLVLFFDGDESGRAGTAAALQKLAPYAFVRAVTLDDGKQPDDLTVNELEAVLSFAK